MNEKDGHYPSLIDGWKLRHTKKKTGVFEDPEAEVLSKIMNGMRTAQEGFDKKMTEGQILDEVLGQLCGFNRGRGRIVKAKSTIDSSVNSHQPGGRVYTQVEVDKMFCVERERTQ